jgi:excisionase family DNA binding protein
VNMAKEFLTLEELSQLLKISRATIDRWRKEGMPFIKMGRGVRFDQDAVMKWIKDNKQN